MKLGYKKTEVGVIPEGWEVETVRDSFKVCNHLRLPISQSVRKNMAGAYPYYGPTGVQDWINEYRVEGGYALIGEDGDHFLKWRSQPMTLLVNGKFNVNNHAHLIQGTKNLTEWFFWFFAYRDLTPYLTRQGAGRYKLTKNSLLAIPCALPEPTEQTAITTALCDVDALLDGLNRLIAKKRDLKQAAMQQLLTGKTRLPGFEKEWEVKRFGELTSPGHGRIDPSRCDPHEFCVELEHIDQCSGSLLGWLATTPHSSLKATFNSGDVLFGKLRAYLRKYWLANRDGVCSTEIWVLKPNRDIVTSGYLYQIVQMDWFIETASTAYGTHMPRSDWKVVKELELHVPPVSEQAVIAAVLSDMDAEITALEQRRNKTKDIKQAMMQELLTGKTRLVTPALQEH